MTQPLETLGRVPFFRSLTDEEVRALDRQCFWRRYGAKQQILRRGEGGTDVFFVIGGAVRALIRAGTGGREVILGDVSAGDFFGELAAIDGQPRSASIIAIAPATVARMPAAVFRAAMHRHPDCCDQLLGVMAAACARWTGA